MYGWIWRHLPFGTWGKVIGSVLLTTAVVALLWYVVFPWAEPILPFDDVQVGTEAPGAPADPGFEPPSGDPVSPGPSTPATGDGHDLPYSTTSNNPPPTPSR